MKRSKDGYRSHHAALEAEAAPLLAQLYPTVFGPGKRQDVTRSTLDMGLGIDAIWECQAEATRIFLQEKVRASKYASRRDVLLRKETPTGQPSDLHKMAADYLVHTYLGPEGLGETIVLNVAIVKRRLAQGTLPHSEFTSSQTGPNYILHIPDLLEAGIYAHHFLPEGGNNAAAA